MDGSKRYTETGEEREWDHKTYCKVDTHALAAAGVSAQRK